MGFFSSIAGFLAEPIVGTIGSIATGLLGQKGANDRNEQQIALTNQFIFDSFFNIKMARPMPMYSVPGAIDHF